MRLGIFLCFLMGISAAAHALDEPELATYFAGKSGCFILYDVNQGKVSLSYNLATRCNERISPDSTFKVPLSLMAFDRKVITQDTVFKWDGKNYPRPGWNHDQTPKTWMQESVVWVSQVLTPKLGADAIGKYLKGFNYGNQDFSGDLGKNNGLTQAWLDSSLKISAVEQLAFIKALNASRLPVSKEAMENTKANIFLETLPNGWKFYGKTGSGSHEGSRTLTNGWFAGFAQKGPHQVVFVLNFSDLEPTTERDSPGIRAKNIVKRIFAKLD